MCIKKTTPGGRKDGKWVSSDEDDSITQEDHFVEGKVVTAACKERVERE